MKTQIFSEKDLIEAAHLLQKGQLVAFPTETVYGLGAPIFAPVAIAEIFRVKGRPQDNPLIAHGPWEFITTDLPKTFFQLAEAFFPGPLTLVVKKHPSVPSIVSAGLDTIAIRQPAHPIAQKLIELTDQPLVAPSANLSGRPSSTTAQHVLADFDGKISAVVEGGACRHGIESTVIDLVSFERPTLLRPGALKKEAIEVVLGAPLDIYTSGPKSSPGMKYRHYAPSIPVHTYTDRAQFVAHLKRGKNTYAISHLEAKDLYALLRKADVEGFEEIAIDASHCTDLALLNRLEKIAEKLNY